MKIKQIKQDLEIYDCKHGDLIAIRTENNSVSLTISKKGKILIDGKPHDTTLQNVGIKTLQNEAIDQAFRELSETIQNHTKRLHEIEKILEDKQ